MTLSAIDVCAGAGGLSLGLQRAGFGVLGVEHDADACETHRSQVGPCDLADVTTWHPAGPVTLVAGGVPCQSFSLAGKRLGILDVRGSLFEQLVRVAVEAQARVVLLENVRGMVSLGMVPIIEAAYRAAGYEPVHALLDSCDYGVPQHRVRLFVIGFRRPEDRAAFRWPSPSHGPPGGCLGLPPWVTVRQALGLTLDEPSPAAVTSVEGQDGVRGLRGGTARGRGAGYAIARRLDATSPCVTAREQCSALAPHTRGGRSPLRRAGDVLKPALSRLDRPAPTVCGGGTDTGGAEPLGNQRVRREFGAALDAAGLLDRPATTVQSVARGRLSAAGHHERQFPAGSGLLDRPATTVDTTNGIAPAGVHERDKPAVRLTVAHLAALQGFPEGFAFHGNVTSQHRQVGNAVCPAVGEAIGRAILLAIQREKPEAA